MDGVKPSYWVTDKKTINFRVLTQSYHVTNIIPNHPNYLAFHWTSLVTWDADIFSNHLYWAGYLPSFGLHNSRTAEAIDLALSIIYTLCGECHHGVSTYLTIFLLTYPTNVSKMNISKFCAINDYFYKSIIIVIDPIIQMLQELCNRCTLVGRYLWTLQRVR